MSVSFKISKERIVQVDIDEPRFAAEKVYSISGLDWEDFKNDINDSLDVGDTIFYDQADLTIIRISDRDDGCDDLCGWAIFEGEAEDKDVLKAIRWGSYYNYAFEGCEHSDFEAEIWLYRNRAVSEIDVCGWVEIETKKQLEKFRDNSNDIMIVKDPELVTDRMSDLQIFDIREYEGAYEKDFELGLSGHFDYRAFAKL